MIVRRAIQSDAEFIASHLLLAMKDIVCTFIGERNFQEANEFMRHFAGRENNQYSFQNCWVVEVSGKVVGAANVYDGGKLHDLRSPVVDYIRAGFNPNFNPEDETQAGEYYLDTLGVDPSLHGRGIGTRLLQFIIDDYVTARKQTVGLLVEEDNMKARRLYAKLGFKSVGGRSLFGKNMEHLQIGGNGIVPTSLWSKLPPR